jgi:hypothetical protein
MHVLRPHADILLELASSSALASRLQLWEGCSLLDVVVNDEGTHVVTGRLVVLGMSTIAVRELRH